MELVRDGEAAAAIVVTDTSDVAVFAAEELRRYVELMSGAALSHGAADGLVPAYIGTRDTLPFDDLPASKPGFDGYVIEARADRLVIAGDNERGVLYGVYDLLERLGCRWYYPGIDAEDPEIIPQARTVALEPFSAAEASPFEFRVCHASSVIYQLRPRDALAQVDWAAKARYNVVLYLLTGRALLEEDDAEVGTAPAQMLDEGDQAPGDKPLYISPEEFWAGTAEYESTGVAPALRRRGMLLEGPNHCMLFLLPNRLFDERPEWFGMDSEGNRRPQGALGPEFCWSNAEAVAHFVENAVAWLSANPHVDVFSCAPNDGGKACECPACRQSSPSDLYAGVMNELMAGIRRADLPVALEILGGYPPVAEPPTTTALDPEIRVHWAHWGRPHHLWYGADDYPMRENLAKWMSLPNAFTMIDYYTDAFATPPLFPPVADQMQRDTDWLREQGAAGVASLMYPHGSWWSYTLNAWLACSWFYADRPVRELLDDYCRHYFGAAGPAMAAHHRILTEHMWLAYFAQGARWFAPEWSPPASEVEQAGPLLDELEGLLDEAEKLAIEPLDAYRLSRALATGRVLVLLGRARLDNAALIGELAEVRRADADLAPLAERLRAALARERDVIEPAVAALYQHRGLLAEGFESAKLLGASAALEEELARLEATTA